MEKWNTKERQEFRKASEKYNAPFFLREGGTIYHYILDTSTILPYTDSPQNFNQVEETVTRNADHDEDGREDTGGYSEILCVNLHPSHFHFGDYGAFMASDAFAIKKLATKAEIDFEEEVIALLRFAHRNDKQLVKLLTTFELRRGPKVTYHLVFPQAQGSVRTLWKQNPTVDCRDPKHILWMAREMSAIGDALSFLHVEYAEGLNPKEREKLRFGRHGDIKAANFLVYYDPLESYRDGQIYMADFGLARWHRQDSRSKVHGKATSPSYRPPEFDIGTLSRKSDIWSLGAFFLEFVTWHLEGWKAVEDDFPNAREEKDILNVESDIFFRLNTIGDERKPVVKSQVVAWAEALHGHPECTQYLHDLLRLIMENMLVAERDNRIEAWMLRDRLETMYERCKSDRGYYMQRCPISSRSA
ncbi:kinase-like protein [Thozetella sp. PMI_491]|nr:kinase-like protein [Thozetella sp. PMI_491]